MKKYLKSVKRTILVASAICLSLSCTDSWEKHYSMDKSVVPDKTIAERLADAQTSQRFIEALKSTKMMNGNKVVGITYYDYLGLDQFVTVWAPSDDAYSAEEWEKFTKPNKTFQENKDVAQRLVMNHIARYNHTVGGSTDEHVRMFSKKRYHSVANDIAGVSYQKDGKNLPCTNGILHLLDGAIPYLPSIYEFITTDAAYRDNLGALFESYTKDEVDELRSVVAGVDENGEPIYIDSVTFKYSILMNTYGKISEEDSNYVVVLPSAETWKETFDTVKVFYDYKTNAMSQHVADSLQMLYTSKALLTDMFFNMNLSYNRGVDSVVSTLYMPYTERLEEEVLHKYRNPYDAEGIFRKNVVDSVICSNGKIYITDGWNFDPLYTYFRKIKLEGESSSYIKSKTLCDWRLQIKRNVPGQPKVSGEYLMQVNGTSEGANWSMVYSVPNNLKAKYHLSLVTVRNKVFNADEDLPNVFHPYGYYNNALIFNPLNARKRELDFYSYKADDGTTNMIDTIDLGTFDVKYCNYDQLKSKLDIEIKNKTKSTDIGKYVTTMYIDCFILTPVGKVDEE